MTRAELAQESNGLLPPDELPGWSRRSRGAVNRLAERLEDA